MKQHVQQVRSKLLSLTLSSLIVTGVAGVGFATAAIAAGAAASSNAGMGAQAGGTASEHMSDSGSANSNAQWQNGATQGADRAAARTSTTGAEMKQSGGAQLDDIGKAAVKGKR